MTGKNIDLYTEEREKENLLLGIKNIQKKKENIARRV
jgi:hypothetical protein